MTFWETIRPLFTNQILLVSAFSWFMSQLIKATINIIVYRKFSLERLFGDGGMPSGHSATVTALAIMTGYYEGFGSALFAVSAIFAIVVMHDAMGVRRETGKHAVSIMELADAVNNLFLEDDHGIKTENLKVLVGHTPLQVILGSVLGAVLAISHILLNIISELI